MKPRTLTFSVLVIACGVAIAVSIFVADRRSNPKAISFPPDPQAAEANHQVPVAPTRASAESNPSALDTGTMGEANRAVKAADGHLLYFRANMLGENYGKLAVARLGALDRTRYSSELKCERVDFAGGTGICLTADRGLFTSFYAIKFDYEMRRGWSIKLNGPPSRARVSANGRLAAITVFLSGHSYASLDFSTQTTIIDTATGNVIADLEQFSVTRDGEAFKSPDFNFWGVTFAANEKVFYATLWSKGRTYLVKGDLGARRMTVIHDGVECPSLSPDNQRIAFKKRVEGTNFAWRITVLDLKTGIETSLGENRSVDDQVEWLDNHHLLYALSQGDATQASASTDIWELPTTASGVPRLMMRGGYSPSVATAPPVAVGSADDHSIKRPLLTRRSGK